MGGEGALFEGAPPWSAAVTVAYLSGTSDFVPTWSVFKGRCHCCLVCAR